MGVGELTTSTTMFVSWWERKQVRLTTTLSHIHFPQSRHWSRQSEAHWLLWPFPTHIFPVSGQYPHTGCVVIFLRKEFSPPLFFCLILFWFLIYAILLYLCILSSFKITVEWDKAKTKAFRRESNVSRDTFEAHILNVKAFLPPRLFITLELKYLDKKASLTDKTGHFNRSLPLWSLCCFLRKENIP